AELHRGGWRLTFEVSRGCHGTVSSPCHHGPRPGRGPFFIPRRFLVGTGIADYDQCRHDKRCPRAAFATDTNQAGRTTMRKITTMAGTLLLTLSAAAIASEGLYMGPSISHYRLDKDRSYSGSSDSTLAAINLGYRFAGPIALELGYGTDLGGADPASITPARPAHTHHPRRP